MSINIFYTFEELKNTGLKMIDGNRCPKDIAIGETYLSNKVICMWDFNCYDDYYTYFDDSIHLVVQVCKKIDKTYTKCENLKKDLSNLTIGE
jgi:hypothetical protein